MSQTLLRSEIQVCSSDSNKFNPRIHSTLFNVFHHMFLD